MKTLLMLGAGALYSDTINSLRNAGIRVVCVDKNPNAPSRKLAHVFENVDIRDVNGLLQVARRHRVDGIMPVSEYGVLPASEVASKLGLPGLAYEVACNSTDKGRMRRLWMDAGVHQQDYYLVNNTRQAIDAGLSLDYPFILKPVDNCASRGVVMVRNPREVEKLFGETIRSSESRQVIAESFLEGEEFSVEAVVRRKRVTILAIALKEIDPPFPYCITRALNYGFSLSSNEKADLENQLQKAVDALSLDNWVIHSEFILTKHGWRIIELAARGGGGYIFGSIVEYVSGYPYVAALAKRVIGEDLPLPSGIRSFGSSFRFLIPSPGRLISIKGINAARSLPYVNRAEVWTKRGDIVHSVTNGTQRSGCVITRAPDFETALKAGIEAHNIIRLEVKSI